MGGDLSHSSCHDTRYSRHEVLPARGTPDTRYSGAYDKDGEVCDTGWGTGGGRGGGGGLGPDDGRLLIAIINKKKSNQQGPSRTVYTSSQVFNQNKMFNCSRPKS